MFRRERFPFRSLTISLMLNWDPPQRDGGSPVTGYLVYRDSELIAELSFDRNDHNDTDVVNDEVYRYLLYALNAAGESAPTDTIWGYPISFDIDHDPPTPPVDLFFTVYDGIVTLGWSSPTDDGGLSLESYRVYRSRYRDGPFDLMASVDADVYSWSDTDVERNIEYHYHVTALNSMYESAPSNSVTVMVGSDDTKNDTEKGIPISLILILSALILLFIIVIVFLMTRKRQRKDEEGPPASGYDFDTIQGSSGVHQDEDYGEGFEE